MFYLRNIKQLLKRSPFLLLSYFLIAISVPTIIFYSSKISKEVVKISKSGAPESFFHALINKDQNFLRFSRKIKSLPGVRNVEVLSPQKMEEQAKQILANLEVGISSEVLNVGYAGLKVIFESGLKVKSMDLVRDYLSRLVGQENITVGELVKVDKKIPKSEVWSFVIKYFQQILISLMMGIWIISNLVFAKIFNNQVYLIQSFQRAKNIPFKIYAFNTLLFIITPIMILSLIKFSSLSLVMVILAAVLGSLPHFKRWQWITK